MQRPHILLVEDNDGDILLTREALEEAKISIKLSVVKDGKEAIDFVSRSGNHRNASPPDIMLLDINLPKKNGHEVLKYLKGNENFKHIPVIMLTTSSSQRDIDLSYDNYANCYITKPTDVTDFLSVIAILESFWLSTVKLPTKKL